MRIHRDGPIYSTNVNVTINIVMCKLLYIKIHILEFIESMKAIKAVSMLGTSSYSGPSCSVNSGQSVNRIMWYPSILLDWHNILKYLNDDRQPVLLETHLMLNTLVNMYAVFF